MVVAAQVRNSIINESVLEPNVGMANKGVLVARVIARPKEQKISIQLINHGVKPIKLYKGMKVGDLQQADDIEMNGR